jgi:hypothetical protein
VGVEQSGQATVELIAVLPLLVLLALGAGQLMAAGRAKELAGHAAAAGAVALIQGQEPTRAARESLPDGFGHRLQVTASDRRVAVELRPAAVLPGLSGMLAARVTADAGPAH